MLNKKISASYGLCVNMDENYTTVFRSSVEVCQDQRKCLGIPYVQVLYLPCTVQSIMYMFDPHISPSPPPPTYLPSVDTIDEVYVIVIVSNSMWTMLIILTYS